MLLNYDYDEQLVAEVQEEARFVRLMNDEYAQIFFDDNIRDIQTILRIIMDKPDLEVKSVKIQEALYGSDDSHSVIFDVYAVDSDGTQYDIEIQRKSAGANPYRASFNCAMMTVNSLKKNERYSNLAKHKQVVIFITLHDVMKKNLPLYTIKRTCLETGEEFSDGTCIIYLNTAHKDYTTAIGRLIHDFRCSKPEELYSKDFAETASRIYRNEGGKLMKTVKAIEARGEARGKAIGEAIGEARGIAKVAMNLLKAGKFALEDIAEACNMTLQQVQELAASVKA